MLGLRRVFISVKRVKVRADDSSNAARSSHELRGSSLGLRLTFRSRASASDPGYVLLGLLRVHPTCKIVSDMADTNPHACTKCQSMELRWVMV